ncbi:MAG: HEAT repeat domain-containing protein, partial [Salinibacterium sp.]|nr:HEAT repeat domain-containing protein [Salinibacterium sp.]
MTAFADGAGDVKKAFKSGDKDQVLAALKQITGHLDDDATRALVDNAARLKGLGVYDELVACLRSGGTDVVGELSKAYKKQKRGDVRFLIVDALGPNADTGAEATLAEALEKDKDEPVRVLAARLLGQRRTPSAVDVLIGALGKLEGDAKAARLAREVNGALCNLTGQDISVVEDWRNYWSSNKDSFNAGGGSDEPDDGKTRSAVDRMKRERPAEMKTMLRMKQDGIVCIKGRSDKVEKVLDALELKHDVVEHEAFDALTLKPEEQILIFNCPGGADYSDAGVQKVRDFVGAGGYVFCSDWSLKKLLVKAFPEAVEYQGQSPKRDKNDHLLVRIQPFKETVDHPLMRDVF